MLESIANTLWDIVRSLVVIGLSVTLIVLFVLFVVFIIVSIIVELKDEGKNSGVSTDTYIKYLDYDEYAALERCLASARRIDMKIDEMGKIVEKIKKQAKDMEQDESE